MKSPLRILFQSALLSAAFVASAHAGDYKIDPSHSSLGFEVRHLVSKVQGLVRDFEGTFSFDAGDLSKFKLKGTAKATSIDTGNAKRDEHLRSPDFFDVRKFPAMSFESTKIEKSGDKYKVSGNLSMHGVTKPVTFDVESMGEAKDPWGNTRAGFSATTNINRKDFGIIWNKTLDTGSVMLGEDVKFKIDLEAIKEEAGAKKK